MYRARNLRECQEQLNRNLVQTFLLSNQSEMMINDDEVDSDEPMCLFCGNSTRGLRCEYCRQRPNGKQLSHLIELKSLTSTCFECPCSGQTYDCRTNVTDGCSCLSHLLDSNLVDFDFSRF